MSTTATPNQKRYRDWRAPVTSKDSMEPFSILSGLGPKYGFDRFSQIAIYGDSVNLTIGHLNQSLGTGATQHKGFTNADQSVYVLGGVVISPDGIITTVNEDLPFSWNKATNTVFTESGASFIEVVLVATHNYIEDEVGLAHSTNFRLILNTNALSIKGAVGFRDYVNGGTKRLSDWLSHPVITGNIDTTNEVIVGLYRINLTTPTNSELVVLYDYNWPSLKVPTYLDWVNINNLVAELADNMVTLEGDQSISGIKSFSESPTVPNPAEDGDAANKGYVDTTVSAASSGIQMMACVFLAPDGTSSLYKGSALVKAVNVAYNGGDDIYTVTFYKDLAKTQVLELSKTTDMAIVNLNDTNRGLATPFISTPANNIFIDISGGDSYAYLKFLRVV